MIIADHSKFGFYKVGNFRTYSKLEAIEHSAKVNQPVEWDFNREQFLQLDWTQEPPGSLEFWYEQRARQLREKYDYIVLWYSGGADSHNALMSFVKNNIFIDEIAQFHNLSGDQGNKKTYLNEEVFVTAAPFTQQLIQNNPVYQHTKHRLLELTDLQLDLFTRDNNKWDYFYKVSTFPSSNALSRSYIRETVPEYQQLMDKGKSVCFIYGAEKPFIETHNNHWYMVFQDRLDYAVSPRTQMLNRDWEHNELFYWTHDLPQLVIKQAHVLKQFLQKLTPKDIDNVYVASKSKLVDEYGRRAINSWWGDIEINNVRYQLLPDGLHRLIYPYWTPESIVIDKPASLMYSPRDTWIFKSNAQDIGQQYYNYGLLKLRKQVKDANPDYWWEFKFDPRLGRPYSGGMKGLFNKYKIS
jgi:hypothetical protein